jgi:multidrug efflux system outer membrane protein
VAWIPRSSLAPALAGLGLLLAGCRAVGPDYVAPKPSVPASFAEAPGHTSGQASEALFIDDAWWKNFADPTLNTLIAQALKSAPDLAEAQARVREARALQGIAGAARYPTADATGEYARNLGSDNVPGSMPPGRSISSVAFAALSRPRMPTSRRWPRIAPM